MLVVTICCAVLTLITWILGKELEKQTDELNRLILENAELKRMLKKNELV